MARKKAKNLIDVLQRSMGTSGPVFGKPRASKPGTRSRKVAGASPGGGGVGERKIQVSLSLNALLGLVLFLAVLLAGMYGLGRYQALAGTRQGKSAALASMEMAPGTSPAAAPRRGGRSVSGKKAGVSRKRAARAPETRKGLCVISYAYTARGKKLAVQMVKWLRSQGLSDALYASYESKKGKSWMVVVPLGGESPQALTRRVMALKAPPFAEKSFRFADQKMFYVTLRVGG